MVVKDIAKYVSYLDDVYVFTNVITPSYTIDNFKIVQHKWIDIIKNIRFTNIINAIHNFFTINTTFKNKIKYIYYSLDAGYMKKIIKSLAVDVVHFHGVCYKTEIGIGICQKLNQKYIVTLHGLVDVYCNNEQKYLKKSENKILTYLSKQNTPVTVVSTGVKNKIQNIYELERVNNITVINNGTDIGYSETYNKYRNNNDGDFANDYVDIYKEYNIPINKKVMLCVGNISVAKNQIQVIRAFSLLDLNIKNKLCLLIIGNIDKSLELDKLIERYNLSESIKLCGFLTKSKLVYYYKQASFNILASLTEGFGMSIIEAFNYGIPSVTFNDIDAIYDLYDEKVMLVSNDRSDIELAKCIQKLYLTKWDVDYIKNYAKNFSYKNMVDKYRNLYNKIKDL